MTTQQAYTITQPTQLHFGAGIVNKLPEVITELGGGKPFVVIDPGLEKAGLDQNITSVLDKAGLAYIVYNKVDPEPGLKLADTGAEIALREGCDCVIGAGGGSAMDVAKAIAILLTNGGKAVDYLGLGKIKNRACPKS